MAESGNDTNLETLLNNAINPSKKAEDWDAINEFCDQINKEYEGPQVACRLLTHKIQSPQEWEAMLALTVAEACVKNCGRRFHSEVGKFRFLNEIIKVVSPKYLGTRSSAKVKKKCVESLYCWKKGLPTEPKIPEAYDMLKRQGIITEDPTYLDETIPDFAQRPKSILFSDDQEKEDLLSRLLKSKDPEDLQAANRLIKSLVKKDEQRTERVSRRITELDKINTNISVLTDMLNQYDAQATSQAEKDTMKELFDSLESLRPALFRLASDADEKDDEGLKDVLQANDAVVKVLDEYKRLVEGNYTPTENLLDDLVDLLGQESTTPSRNSGSMSLLDLDFEKLGLNDTSMIPLSPPPASSNSAAPSFNSVIPNAGHAAQPSYHAASYRPAAAPMMAANPVAASAASHPASSLQDSQRNAFDDINGFSFFQFNASSSAPKSNPPPPYEPPAASQATTPLIPSAPPPAAAAPAPAAPVGPVQPAASSSPPAVHVAPLTDLTVRLEDIQPSSLPSQTIYDRNHIKILLHFVANVPRDDVRVLVISASSQHTVPVKSMVFQAAVPKNMKIKLQPPTGTELPAYNPILPQAAITQVLLLANPNQERVRLKFKVSYSVNGVTQNDVGDVEAFPEWSALMFS